MAIFGVRLPRPVTYWEWYRLQLNRDRALLQKAMSTAWGTAIASGTEPVDLDFFLAVCETVEEAKQMRDSTNALRKLARMQAKRKD